MSSQDAGRAATGSFAWGGRSGDGGQGLVTDFGERTGVLAIAEVDPGRRPS